MRYGLLGIFVSLLISQARGYKCNKGTCDQTDQCCNTQSFYGNTCCQASAKCCYHHHWTACCGPLDTCCWGYHYRGVSCCPPGFRCCGVGRLGRRSGCCWITPLWIWILLGICGSVIVALLLLSLYQCIQEEYSEYQSQRTAGNLPSDNSWYYYDYGSTLTRDYRNTSSNHGRQPPEYEPPPSYSNSGNSNPGTANGSRGNNMNNVPKPPTPQNARNNALSRGTESRETEYHSSTEGHVHSSNSEFHSLASEPYSDNQPKPGDEILRTFYEHSVPKLQRMLCSRHQCTVGDGSCVYCMDLSDHEGLSDLEESSSEESNNNSYQEMEKNNKKQLSDKNTKRVLQRNQPVKEIMNAHNQQSVLH